MPGRRRENSKTGGTGGEEERTGEGGTSLAELGIFE